MQYNGGGDVLGAQPPLFKVRRELCNRPLPTALLCLRRRASRGSCRHAACLGQGNQQEGRRAEEFNRSQNGPLAWQQRWDGAQRRQQRWDARSSGGRRAAGPASGVGVSLLHPVWLIGDHDVDSGLTWRACCLRSCVFQKRNATASSLARVSPFKLVCLVPQASFDEGGEVCDSGMDEERVHLACQRAVRWRCGCKRSPCAPLPILLLLFKFDD